ncbi:CoA pyrophosphatase [bacterium]|nr:CoA pyrophosphatase [bacterium]
MELWIEKLKTRLNGPLPGLPSQLEMAPPLRGQGRLEVPKDARRSAVLVLLYPVDGKPHTVFMKRSDDGHVHSGQISFPGGKTEETDRDNIHTALREADEELGIPGEKVTVLGPLTEMYIPPSNFLVWPILGFMETRPSYVLDPIEVARVIEVPLDKFYQEGVRKIRRIEQRTKFGNFTTESPSFQIGEDIIWGATSMITNELLHIVNSISTVDDID